MLTTMASLATRNTTGMNLSESGQFAEKRQLLMKTRYPQAGRAQPYPGFHGLTTPCCVDQSRPVGSTTSLKGLRRSDLQCLGRADRVACCTLLEPGLKRGKMIQPTIEVTIVAVSVDISMIFPQNPKSWIK